MNDRSSTTNDLAKDINEPGSEYKNQEGESHSTAAEGELKTEEQDENKKPDSDDKHPAKETERKVDSTATTTLKQDETTTADDITS